MKSFRILSLFVLWVCFGLFAEGAKRAEPTQIREESYTAILPLTYSENCEMFYDKSEELILRVFHRNESFQTNFQRNIFSRNFLT